MATTIAVCSLGGAPGVTTLAVALASMWPDEVAAVVIEADASGGDLAAWQGLPIEPGVVDLAAGARHDASFSSAGEARGPLECSQRLPGGLWVCPAPSSAAQAGTAVGLLAQHPQALRPPGEAVRVLDLGRLMPHSPAAHLAAADEVDAVLVVTGDDIAQLKRARDSVAGLGAGIERLGLAVVGHRESPHQIAAAVGVQVWAPIPVDLRGAAMVRGQRDDRRLPRRPLMTAARRAADRLVEVITPEVRMQEVS